MPTENRVTQYRRSVNEHDSIKCTGNTRPFPTSDFEFSGFCTPLDSRAFLLSVFFFFGFFLTLYITRLNDVNVLYDFTIGDGVGGGETKKIALE